MQPQNNNCSVQESSPFMKFMKKNRWSIFFVLRELSWRIGQINMDDMIKFAEEFNPDLFFIPLYTYTYVDYVFLKLKKIIDVPVMFEASLDVYTLKQISYDPIYWADRFYNRHMIRKVLNLGDLLYVISERQKKDYSRIFSIPCKVIYKMPQTERMNKVYCGRTEDKLKILYTGNIGDGRWESLAYLANAINKCGDARLDIYTATPITKQMERVLNIPGTSYLHEPVPALKVKKLQSEADILVHVESFKLKNKLMVRYSISTKIMDYISAARCILAICPEDVASYEYLRDHQLAYVVNNPERIELEVNRLLNDEDKIIEYANKCREFSQISLNAEMMRASMRKDIEKVSRKLEI